MKTRIDPKSSPRHLDGIGFDAYRRIHDQLTVVMYIASRAKDTLRHSWSSPCRAAPRVKAGVMDGVELVANIRNGKGQAST